jgi:hypothetical protein
LREFPRLKPRSRASDLATRQRRQGAYGDIDREQGLQQR